MARQRRQPRPEISEALTCWKDIARYMGKGVRTVQRWEQQFGLPVRRPSGVTHKTAVLAYPHDLEIWMATHWVQRELETEPAPPYRPKASSPLIERLSSEIQTSRALRSANQALRDEVLDAVETLRGEVGSFRRNKTQ